MKKISYLLVIIFLYSCTSNTIFEKPKDLIPKDTMSLLIQEVLIASSSKFVKNKNLENKISYMPLVYDCFRIDSLRFQSSNLYYMSKIDLYREIFSDAKTSLEKQKSFLEVLKKRRDSLQKDSIKKFNDFGKKQLKIDTLNIDKDDLKPKL